MDNNKKYRDLNIEEAKKFFYYSPNESKEHIEEVINSQTFIGLKNLLEVFSQIIDNNQKSVAKLLEMHNNTIKVLSKQFERDDLSIEEKLFVAKTINDILQEARQTVKDQEEHDIKVIQTIGVITLVGLSLFLTKSKSSSTKLPYLWSLIRKV